MKISLVSLSVLALASFALADKPDRAAPVELRLSNNLRLAYDGAVQTVELPKFNPSQGTLISATIKVYQRPTFEFQALAAPGAPVLHQFFAQTAIELNGREICTDVASTSQRGGYADASGNYSYIGTFGDPNNCVIDASFGGLVGNGTFPVQISSTAWVDTTAPSYDLNVAGNTTVVVSYTYTPK